MVHCIRHVAFGMSTLEVVVGHLAFVDLEHFSGVYLMMGVSCLIEASCVGCLSPQFADADGSGLISSDEFTLLLRSLIYYKECHADFAAIDLDHDRRISIEELMSKEVRSREKLMIC